MFTKPDMIAALNALADQTTLQSAISGLQMYHAPKHLQVTDIRPPNLGFGSSFFMKRKMVPTQVTRPGAWGSGPITETVNRPSEAFGDLEPIDRTDEAKIIGYLKTTDSGAVAADRDDFVFFTDVPHPYVGLDFPFNASLPVEAGYLAVVIGRSGRGYKIRSAYPCTRDRYLTKGAATIHRGVSNKWAG